MKQKENAKLAESVPTILVVDDEVAITKLCKAILERSGYTVLEADGSSEALKICTQHQGRIDLLLADLVLPPLCFQLAPASNPFPHVNGYELAMRASEIRNGLRLILMSGNPDKELLNHGIRRGTLPFIAKPFEGEYLVSLVEHVLTQPAPILAAEQSANAANDMEWYG